MLHSVGAKIIAAFPRNLHAVTGEDAALSLMRVTSPRASAKAWRGVSQPPVTAKAAPVMQLAGVLVRVLEGSGGNIAVLTGPDGKVLVDGGIGVSRAQLTKALSSLGSEPVTHLTRFRRCDRSANGC